jgi:hypothetical protein
MEVDCRGEISQCIAVILLLLGWGFVRFGEMEESCLSCTSCKHWYFWCSGAKRMYLIVRESVQSVDPGSCHQQN